MNLNFSRNVNVFSKFFKNVLSENDFTIKCMLTFFSVRSFKIKFILYDIKYGNL